ncbi:MAG: DUF962 domain-containing protein [Polaribacter sp.]|nr:DUF962 domain-containing protein [Polaribacter sp.]
MKTAQQWFDEYAVSHQNKTNQLFHYICVPAIYFSIIGLLMSIPSTLLESTFGLYNPFIENWATMIFGFILVFFYLRLGFWHFIEMFLLTALCLVGNYWVGNHFNLLLISIAIFVIAWIGQFYGHKIEGKKPSFIKDLQFLLIGPLWVLKKLGTKK